VYRRPTRASGAATLKRIVQLLVVLQQVRDLDRRRFEQYGAVWPALSQKLLTSSQQTANVAHRGDEFRFQR
jgi:hypothetical protein